MITEAVVNWILSAFAWAVGLIPPLPDHVSESVDTYAGNLDQVVQQITYLNPIIPFESIGAAAGVVSAFVVFAAMFQVTRIVVSVATLGGGGV